MRLKTCHVENFGSYPLFDFDFSNVGLALIYGPTGSGKSTIQDMACWCLYGRTAKDGNADEVRSWQSPNVPTRAEVEVELPHGTITVTRVRGKSSENDLYWVERSALDFERRGKDITETQKLLEKRLGVSYELYSTGAYFHEFSATAGFFTATAKVRRALFERIAPLELPARLADRSSVARKEAKASLTARERDRANLSGRLDQLRESIASAVQSAAEWQDKRTNDLKTLQAKFSGFELEKSSRVEALKTKSDNWDRQNTKDIDDLIAKIESLDSKSRPAEEFDKELSELQLQSRCKACGSLQEKVQKQLLKITEEKAKNAQLSTRRTELTDRLQGIVSETNPYTAQIEQAKELDNHYGAQIVSLESQVNPFEGQTQKLNASKEDTYSKLHLAEQECSALELRVSRLTRLYDLSATLRGELLRKAVKEIEDDTNRYLETYFDAELRVTFVLDGDDLEVGIQKSGYDCVYRQLSKGQRGLLRLAFTVAIMKAASNAAGVHFRQLMFDEALDGLDVDLKVRAYGLFEELEQEHETILVIDHSAELKERFGRRFQVTIAGDASMFNEDEQS